MAETTADVRRDIELTRERMSSTLAELEHKLNVVQLVKDNPWPALALAIGAGVLLSGSRADVKAAAATATATKGASSKIATALDDVVAQLVGGVHSAINQRVDGWVDDLKGVIGSSLANGTSSRRKTQHYGVGPIHDLPDGPAAGIGSTTPTRGD
jgi:hypothetical protein